MTLPRLMISIWKLIPILALGISSSTSGSQDFYNMPFLRIKEDKLIAEHSLPFILQITTGFTRIGPFNYREHFNGIPFCVTACAFWNNDTIIAIHAERVSDNSGPLDYSYMDKTLLSDIEFYHRSRIVSIDKGAVNKAKDLRYFKSHGFDFSPSIYLNQFFYHSEDGNAEYVVTIGNKMGDNMESNMRIASDLDTLAAQLSLSLNL